MIATSDSSMLYNVFYYDQKGRVIDERHSTLDNDVYTVFTGYSFTDKPVTVTKAFGYGSGVSTSSNQNSKYAITTKYIYNQYNDQLEAVWVEHDNDSICVSQITYNDLGQIQSEMRPQISDAVNYEYDLHGWTKNIDSNYFKERLHYADGPDSDYYCYNGDISSQLWMAADTAIWRGYKFLYDDRDMLSRALYNEGEGLDLNAEKYNEGVPFYNSNGAIERLVRNGKNNAGIYGPIDLLYYNYDGNKVASIRDHITNQLSYIGAFEYKDTHTATPAEPDFEYNSAGMLIKDRDKGISRITYNNIGLVDSILFDNGAKVVYTYAMNGEKLRVRHHAALPSVVRPLHAPVRDGIFPGTPVSFILYDEESYYGGDIVKKSSVGNRNVYTVPSYRYYFGGGYMEWEAPDVMVGAQITMEPDFYYYTKDHLGSIRSVVRSGTNGPVEVQRAAYYPFGGVIPEFTMSLGTQDHLYNGKELDTSNNLWWYDYGARQYDPTAPRFTTPDRFAEKYYSMNMYGYCGNNPIHYIDINGDTLAVNGNTSDLKKTAALMSKYGNNEYKYENGNIIIHKKTDNPNGYDRFYSKVIDDEATTTINIVNKSKDVAIANGNSATIDIGDIKKIGDRDFVTSGSVIGHEFLEQYKMQVEGKSIEEAHFYASRMEQGMTESSYYIPFNMREQTKTNITFVGVRSSDIQFKNTIKLKIKNGNIK